MTGLDLSQKVPMARSLNQIAQKKAHDLIQLTGRALPASVTAVSGSIVTVKFEIQTSYTTTLPKVTIPLFGPEYIRYPTQVGDKGMVIPADTFLGGMSGLGSGVASLAMPANLSALVFMPIGNKNFSATDNPNATLIYGPDGVILRKVDKSLIIDMSGETIVVTGPVEFKGLVTMDQNLQLGGNIVSQTGETYAGNLATAGSITAGMGGADQVTLQHHTHPANGSPPNPGT